MKIFRWRRYSKCFECVFVLDGGTALVDAVAQFAPTHSHTNNGNSISRRKFRKPILSVGRLNNFNRPALTRVCLRVFVSRQACKLFIYLFAVKQTTIPP